MPRHEGVGHNLILSCWSLISRPCSKTFAISIIHHSAERGYKPTWWVDASAICCWAARPADYDVTTDALPQSDRIFPETYAVGAPVRAWCWFPRREKTNARSLDCIRTSRSEARLIRRDDRTMGVGRGCHVFRCDIGYSDGRSIPTKFGSAKIRAKMERRDFTIKWIVTRSGHERSSGFVGGRKDLEAGIIRTIGDPERALC